MDHTYHVLFKSNLVSFFIEIVPNCTQTIHGGFTINSPPPLQLIVASFIVIFTFHNTCLIFLDIIEVSLTSYSFKFLLKQQAFGSESVSLNNTIC